MTNALLSPIGLQLIIVFIHDQLFSSLIDSLLGKTSEKSENYTSQFSRVMFSLTYITYFIRLEAAKRKTFDDSTFLNGNICCFYLSHIMNSLFGQLSFWENVTFHYFLMFYRPDN